MSEKQKHSVNEPPVEKRVVAFEVMAVVVIVVEDEALVVSKCAKEGCCLLFAFMNRNLRELLMH